MENIYFFIVKCYINFKIYTFSIVKNKYLLYFIINLFFLLFLFGFINLFCKHIFIFQYKSIQILFSTRILLLPIPPNEGEARATWF